MTQADLSRHRVLVWRLAAAVKVKDAVDTLPGCTLPTRVAAEATLQAEEYDTASLK